MIQIFYSLFFFSLQSCAGYTFLIKKNPLKKYHISSLAIPQFLNRSSHPAIAGLCTKEFIATFAKYSHLKMIPGEGFSADGVLIGIITGPDHREKAEKVTGSLFTKKYHKMYLPKTIESTVELDLRLVRRSRGKHVKKIIFEKKYTITSSYKILSSTSGGEEVNAIKNKRSFIRNLQKIAKETALRFQNEFLDAF